MGSRLAAVWLGLLAVVEAGDGWTTALDSARGARELVPVTAAILESGGMPRLLLLKALAVVGLASALLLTLMWSRRSRQGAALYRYVLNGCRIAVVAMALATLNNAVLLQSL